MSLSLCWALMVYACGRGESESDPTQKHYTSERGNDSKVEYNHRTQQATTMMQTCKGIQGEVSPPSPAGNEQLPLVPRWIQKPQRLSQGPSKLHHSHPSLGTSAKGKLYYISSNYPFPLVASVVCLPGFPANRSSIAMGATSKTMQLQPTIQSHFSWIIMTNDMAGCPEHAARHDTKCLIL
uniref:Secreted protein n=1 Tax=Oryza sativa subsp. japonica TaxID=39947 RepID=Q6YS78_ORYSJ|nr:hypothetical protein [Oryza sativa Japonica Group]